MSGTNFSDIFDLFMLQIKDWRLRDLYEASSTDFETYLSGFLILSIQKFSVCTQSLSYDDSTKTFDLVLTDKNKVILAQLMVEFWLVKEVQDVTQFNIHLQDRDFKIYSESQNLREKSTHLDKVKEYNSREMTGYSYIDNTDWADWFSGIFFTP